MGEIQAFIEQQRSKEHSNRLKAEDLTMVRKKVTLGIDIQKVHQTTA